MVETDSEEGVVGGEKEREQICRHVVGCRCAAAHTSDVLDIFG